MGEIHPSHPTAHDLLGTLNLGTYLEIAQRRKWWIILCTLGLSVCATIVAQRLPNIYRAETVILVDAAQVPDNVVKSLNTGDISGRLATLRQQVLSPTRLKKLVEAQKLYPDPTGTLSEEEVIGGLQKSIIVELVNPGSGKMSAFRIAYSGRKRAEVAPIANQLAQMFIDENVTIRVDQSEDITQFLRTQLQETKKQMDELDGKLQGIKSRNIDQMPESKQYHVEALSSLRAQVQTIQDKIQQDNREKNILQSMMISGGGDAPTIDINGDADGRGPYQAQIQKLESKLSELRLRYGPGHPDVRRTQNELERLKTKAASEAAAAAASGQTDTQKPAIQEGRQQKRRNPVVQAQIEKLDEDIALQTRAVAPLQARMDMHEARLGQMPAFEQQISRMQQDYDILRSQYTSLLEKEKAAEISHALEVHQKAEKFEILDPATTPAKPAAPNRLLISLAGLFGGLVGGIALAALTEMNDESVRTENEAARIFGKPVLSGIPLVITREEHHLSNLRALAMVLGTVVGSAALGLIFSLFSGRFL